MLLQTKAICDIINKLKIWPVGQEAKTPPSHGGNSGSIPLRVTNQRHRIRSRHIAQFGVRTPVRDFLFIRVFFCFILPGRMLS